MTTATKNRSKARAKKAPEPQTRQVWTENGHTIVRDLRRSEIPYKTSTGRTTVRHGYRYTVYRPDGTRMSRKAYSKEDAREMSRGKER